VKRIRFSAHARKRALLRGASEDEIRQALATGTREPARRGKWQTRRRFAFAARSPIDGKWYNEKTVEVVFADEPSEIVVVTVKVYYAGPEER